MTGRVDEDWLEGSLQGQTRILIPCHLHQPCSIWIVPGREGEGWISYSAAEWGGQQANQGRCGTVQGARCSTRGCGSVQGGVAQYKGVWISVVCMWYPCIVAML